MARKNLKVSGPSEAPPVAADLTRERPSRSRSVASSSSSAARERRAGPPARPAGPGAAPGLQRLHAGPDAPVEEAPGQRVRVHDPGPHVGRDLLPDAGGEEE